MLTCWLKLIGAKHHTAASHRETRGSDPVVHTGWICLYFSLHFQAVIVRSHLQILGRKRVTCSKTDTKAQSFEVAYESCRCRSLSAQRVGTDWYDFFFLYLIKEIAVIVLTILGVAVRNLVARATRHPGFVHIWSLTTRQNNDPEMALALCTILASDMSPLCDYTIFQTYT